MRTQILLTTVAAALAVITLNVKAGTTVLSPRAAGNQSIVASGITAVQPVSATQSVSPRVLGNQIVTVASVVNDVNPTIACRNMIASPKAIQACASNSNMPGCNKTVVAENMAR